MADMSKVLDNVEESLRTDPPTVQKPEDINLYVPAKHRIANASLQSIQADIRRTIAELEQHHNRLVDYAAQLKRGIEEQLRNVG